MDFETDIYLTIVRERATDVFVLLKRNKVYYEGLPGNPYQTFMTAHARYHRAEQAYQMYPSPGNLEHRKDTARELARVIAETPLKPPTLDERLRAWIRWGKGPKTTT